MGKKNGLVNSEMITEVHVSLQFSFLNEFLHSDCEGHHPEPLVIEIRSKAFKMERNCSLTFKDGEEKGRLVLKNSKNL